MGNSKGIIFHRLKKKETREGDVFLLSEIKEGREIFNTKRGKLWLELDKGASKRTRFSEVDLSKAAMVTYVATTVERITFKGDTIIIQLVSAESEDLYRRYIRPLGVTRNRD